MPFELVQKNSRTKNVEHVSIGYASTRLPNHVMESVGNYVTVLIDPISNQVAFRATDDDDANGYVVTRTGTLTCAAIQKLARRMGVSFSPSPQVPVTYDAELNAWVMDMNDAIRTDQQ